MSETDEVPVQHPMDAFIATLRKLREDTGALSYADIALRVTEQRMALGMTEAAARVSKSTVFDVFQLGRRRLNPDLVREIVRALGMDEAAATEMQLRCMKARRGVPAPLTSTPPENVVPLLVAQTEVVAPEELPPVPEEVVAPEVKEEDYTFAPVRIPARAVALLLVACTTLNLFGGWFVMVARLPLYLDMVGTAIASTVLGPWWGVLVAMGTNGGMTMYDGTTALPFVIVNATGALVWGYGVRRFGMGRSLSRFFTLNLIVAFICTCVAVPILLFEFGGVTGNADSIQALSLSATYHSLLAGVWSSTMLTSLVDKTLCGVGALTAASALPALFKSRLPERWMEQGGMRSERTTHEGRSSGIQWWARAMS